MFCGQCSKNFYIWRQKRNGIQGSSALRRQIKCLGELLVLHGGVGFLAGLPVDSLVVAGAVHGVDLAVLVGVGQAPGHVVDGGAGQVLFEEERLGLGKGGITGVVVVDDLLPSLTRSVNCSKAATTSFW